MSGSTRGPDRDHRPDDLYTLLWNELEEAHKRVLYLGMYLGRWYNARHDHYLRTIAYDAAGLARLAGTIERLAKEQVAEGSVVVRRAQPGEASVASGVPRPKGGEEQERG